MVTTHRLLRSALPVLALAICAATFAPQASAAPYWFETYQSDFVAATMKDIPLSVDEHYQKRQDRAHRRFLSSVKALAQVRRLLGPSVQVNIAEQQVNVAG